MSQEHSFASPAPAGLGALAIAVFGFAAFFLGLVDINGLPLLAAWLFAGFVVQFVVGVVEMKDQNVTGGNVFLFFSAFFMLAAALSVFMKWYMISFMFGPRAAKDALDAAAAATGLRVDMLSPVQIKAAMAEVGPAVGAMVHKAAHVEGWMWMAGAGFLTVATPCYARGSWVFFSGFVLADILLFLIAGLDTGWFSIIDANTTKHIIAYGFIFIGLSSLYHAGAIMVNTVYGKAIIPVPRPLIKPKT
jgi:succinate-acetate transporter protein